MTSTKVQDVKSSLGCQSCQFKLRGYVFSLDAQDVNPLIYISYSIKIQHTLAHLSFDLVLNIYIYMYPRMSVYALSKLQIVPDPIRAIKFSCYCMLFFSAHKYVSTTEGDVSEWYFTHPHAQVIYKGDDLAPLTHINIAWLITWYSQLRVIVRKNPSMDLYFNMSDIHVSLYYTEYGVPQTIHVTTQRQKWTLFFGYMLDVLY